LPIQASRSARIFGRLRCSPQRELAGVRAHGVAQREHEVDQQALAGSAMARRQQRHQDAQVARRRRLEPRRADELGGEAVLEVARTSSRLRSPSRSFDVLALRIEPWPTWTQRASGT
jgi:hypothetical protein